MFLTMGSILLRTPILIIVFYHSFSWCTEQGENNLDESQEDFADREPLPFGVMHSLPNLTNWAAKEELIVEVLLERLEMLEKESDLIESFLEDYRLTSGEALANVIEPKETPEDRGVVIGSSAVLSHIMTHRYTSIVKRLRKLWQSTNYSENIHNIEDILEVGKNPEVEPNRIPVLSLSEDQLSYDVLKVLLDMESSSNETTERTGAVWPSWRDTYLSMLSFLNIQEVYGYHPEDLRHGLPIDTTIGGQLNARQCAEIGMFALYRGFYYMAIEWLEVAETLSGSEDNHDNSISTELVTSLLQITIQEHNIGYSDRYANSKFDDYYLEPVDEGQPRNERIPGRSEMFNYYGGLGPDAFPLYQYYGLCAGIKYQTPDTQKTLKCYYEKARHPYLYINPVKTEVLSESPPILQLYEMLGNKSIEIIKQTAIPKLQLSQLVGTYTLEDITKFRTSAGAAFKYKDHPKMYEIAEIVTGLNFEQVVELSQVAEYVYGRYYTYHKDALEDEEETMSSVNIHGDRLATLLYYLETAEIGGGTPFCEAGVSSRQVRGSAILWFNFYRNGTARQDVDHGACPVIHGRKIILNQWIRAGINWNNYKCSLNQFE